MKCRKLHIAVNTLLTRLNLVPFGTVYLFFTRDRVQTFYLITGGMSWPECGEVKSIRQHARTDGSLGDLAFVRSLESTTVKKLAPKPAGRKCYKDK